MSQKLQVRNYISILFFIILGRSVDAKPSAFINAIELGVTEKGPNLNLIKNISDKNQITFGLHYFEGNISSLEYSLTEPSPILFSSKGIQFSFKHFFNESPNKSRFFAQVGLDLSSLKASSVIDLDNQIYDLGNLTITCRTCGDIIISTRNDFKFIPSLLFGLQKKVNDNLSFTLAAGIQYFNIPNVEWENTDNLSLPSYVRNKIDLIAEQANQELDKYGNIIPTLKLSTTFHF